MTIGLAARFGPEKFFGDRQAADARNCQASTCSSPILFALRRRSIRRPGWPRPALQMPCVLERPGRKTIGTGMRQRPRRGACATMSGSEAFLFPPGRAVGNQCNMAPLPRVRITSPVINNNQPWPNARDGRRGRRHCRGAHRSGHLRIQFFAAAIHNSL